MTTSETDIFEGGKMLPLMEEFYTIQGEGYNTGKAAYFIRIGGCDVGCHWCDVKESWDSSKHPLTHVDRIIENVLLQKAESVVITGGEPSNYPMQYITQSLKDHNILTFIETSGAYPLTGIWDWICLSPKKTMPPLDMYYGVAHELKMIVHNNHDFEWAEQNKQKCLAAGNECNFYLQPEWSKAATMIPLIVDYVMLHPEWKVSLQTHKYMHIP
jgi:7-carboxy-7-deazaguanine synthase